jgi:hypothetical protein
MLKILPKYLDEYFSIDQLHMYNPWSTRTYCEHAPMLASKYDRDELETDQVAKINEN